MATDTDNIDKADPNDAAVAQKAMAIANASPIALPIQLQRAFLLTASKVLRIPSLAYRRDRTLQRQMRNDPDVESPLNDLRLAVVCNDWSVVPDKRDPSDRGVEIAEFVAQVIDDIPGFTDYMMWLMESVWYGPSACNHVWARRDGDIVPGYWLPIHPDSIVFTYEGKMGLRINARTGYFEGAPDLATDAIRGYDSPVHLLTPEERASMTFMSFQRRAPDFEELFDTAYAFGGRGYRDVCWFYWFMKQTVLQSWLGYCERHSQGTRVGRYPMGNERAKEEMESILRNMIGDNSALLPRAEGQASGMEDAYDIEIIDPPAARSQVYADLVDWLSSNLKELIVGQSITSEIKKAGTGTGVAVEHAKTFSRHVRYVAKLLGEALTRDLVRQIVDLNFGPQKHYPTFAVSVDHPEADRHIAAVETFVNLGGEVSENDTRRILGLRRPRAGEPTLSLSTMAAAYSPIGGAPVAGVAVARDGDGDGLIREAEAKDPFARASVRDLFEMASKRRRKSKAKAKQGSNCGNTGDGFAEGNKCAEGRHNYPKHRKSPTKRRTGRKKAKPHGDDA
jgi:phage gp29-like protein